MVNNFSNSLLGLFIFCFWKYHVRYPIGYFFKKKPGCGKSSKCIPKKSHVCILVVLKVIQANKRTMTLFTLRDITIDTSFCSVLMSQITKIVRILGHKTVVRWKTFDSHRSRLYLFLYM